MSLVQAGTVEEAPADSPRKMVEDMFRSRGQDSCDLSIGLQHQIALGYYATPAIMRLTRSGMLEVLESDYIRTARAKGLRNTSVLFKHALRNAVAPVVALAAVQLGFLLGGSVVIETVFALNGLGYLAWEAILHNDFPVVQAIVLLIACIYIVLTFLADLANGWLDPRIRIA